MAYKRVILSSAESERNEITKYLFGVSGRTAVASFLDSLDQEVDLVTSMPTIYALSRIGDLAAKGYRVAFFGSYAMLYRFEKDTVYIAHVFHQRQDYAHLV